MTGNELRRLRRRLGITQQRLADLVGVPLNTIARWERGVMRMGPAMTKLIRLTVAKEKPMPMKERYDASRGGHAPGHLRAWFETYAETGKIEDAMREREITVDWLLGQLWNCRDVMPSETCNELDLSPGSTYARAARALKRR